MKTLSRRIFISTFSLFILPFLIPGFHISQGISMLLWGGIVLSLLFFLLKPILNLLSFPANLLTFGLFSLVNNALILYLLTVFVGSISVEAFTFPRTDFLGIILPQTKFNTFFAYIVTACVLSCVDSFFVWLMN